MLLLASTILAVHGSTMCVEATALWYDTMLVSMAPVLARQLCQACCSEATCSCSTTQAAPPQGVIAYRSHAAAPPVPVISRPATSVTAPACATSPTGLRAKLSKLQSCVASIAPAAPEQGAQVGLAAHMAPLAARAAMMMHTAAVHSTAPACRRVEQALLRAIAHRGSAAGYSSQRLCCGL